MRAFALVDCNDFYVSCERVFDPRLDGRVVVVLSNNDGNVISRSAEAKAEGVPMGAPWHEARALVEKAGGAALSSNYVLYGDMSARVREVLGGFAPRIEIYSIDEAFLDLDNIAGLDLIEHAREIRRRVGQWTGIPVGVGIGPTKTLAKAANRLAKNNGGVFALFEQPAIRAALAGMEAEDVWGIGRRWGRRLRAMGISTALALSDADPGMIRKRFSVVLQRTALELRGTPCIELEEVPPTKKQIVVSRAFGKKVTELRELRSGVAYYMTRAAEKLRSGGLVAREISVFVHTNHFSGKDRQYDNAASLRLPWGTDDTGTLIRHALHILERIFRPGYRYHKAGVMLMELGPAGAAQDDLFGQGPPRKPDLMRAIDSINEKMGRGAVRYSTEGFAASWRRKSDRCSPRYTTRWEELPKVRATVPETLLSDRGNELPKAGTPPIARHGRSVG